MKSRSICMGVILCVAAGALHAQSAVPASQRQSPKGPRVVRLTFTPAAEPQPALKYLLLPTMLDQESGNAEPILNTASLLAEEFRRAASTEKVYERIIDWIDTPVDKLPREEVRKVLDDARTTLRYARVASRREWCVWDVPYRSEGVNTQLPALSGQRLIIRLLALRARLAIADGRFNDALEDLQSVAVIGHWQGQAPTLIDGLVGASIATVAARELEDWIGQPQSPNLYWALTSLPRPWVDASRGFQGERLLVNLELPRLRDLDSVAMPDEQVRAIRDGVEKLLALGAIDAKPTAVSVSETLNKWRTGVAAHQQEARKHLLAAGYKPSFVESISAEQAVLLRLYDEYRPVRDDYYKCFALPYRQTQDALAKAEARIEKDRSRIAQEYGSALFMGVIPSLIRARFIQARLDRDVAVLRCVEAIRLYAAGHGGTLPAALKDITEVPVPEDPITGQPFVYEFAGDHAVLVGRVPDAESNDNIRYELRVRR